MSETPPVDPTPGTADSELSEPVTKENMVSQAQSLLDDVVTMLRKDRKRCKNIYKLHFPELYAMINNDAIFFKVVRRLGRRDNISNTDLSDLLLPTKRVELERAARISAGKDLTDAELVDVKGMCDNILVLINHRAYLNHFLTNKCTPFIQNSIGPGGIQVPPLTITETRPLINTVKQPECTPSCSNTHILLNRRIYEDYHCNLSTLANCAAAAKIAMERERSLDDNETRRSGRMRYARVSRAIRKHFMYEQTSENDADDEASDLEVNARPSRKERRRR
ncbi:nucleolar protein 58 [Manduca sexta]|uniref:NOSIC domain-containing protein n=1 Tax=Manduca sexta TaxID=7130 RepID=A0A922CDF5_MANSE|nr:nucleolar protein 58 [Manduca sexta]KAG6442835.1 hypothetical protein O3G_MSEX002522 [Manduca sexta]